MNVLLPTLPVAFAAFCVWLGVRVVNRRERWAKWTLPAATVLCLVMVYLAAYLGMRQVARLRIGEHRQDVGFAFVESVDGAADRRLGGEEIVAPLREGGDGF